MSEIKKIATRVSYGEALRDLGDTNDNVVVLDADLSKSTMTNTFKVAHPNRFVNCGIAEANMMSIAAGIASTGKTVFASSFAMFAAGRAFEQIRNSICYPNLNVKIGASHGGISIGEDGASHQCCEDFALMRSIPKMVVISPSDDIETKAAVKAAAEYEGPVYIRLGRLPVEVINDSADYKFEWGKGITLRDGKDVTIVATGLLVQESLKAAKILEADGIDVRVINIHTIKPIDKDLILKAAKETKFIITAEEHNIYGGLGDEVSKVVTESHPTRVVRIGVEDRFGMSGPANELLEFFGFTAEGIAKKVKESI